MQVKFHEELLGVKDVHAMGNQNFLWVLLFIVVMVVVACIGFNLEILNLRLYIYRQSFCHGDTSLGFSVGNFGFPPLDKRLIRKN